MVATPASDLKWICENALVVNFVDEIFYVGHAPHDAAVLGCFVGCPLIAVM